MTDSGLLCGPQPLLKIGPEAIDVGLADLAGGNVDHLVGRNHAVVALGQFAKTSIDL